MSNPFETTDAEIERRCRRHTWGYYAWLAAGAAAINAWGYGKTVGWSNWVEIPLLVAGYLMLAQAGENMCNRRWWRRIQSARKRGAGRTVTYVREV